VTATIGDEVVEQLRRADPDGRGIYERMVAIIAELPAIGKTQHNTQQNFMFRGHDDVMNALNPLLSKHGVFIVPNVLERIAGERLTGNNKTMYEVNLHVEFTFYGLRGDSVQASGWGEGTDMGDKATSKAMTMAIKYVIGQAFALATAEMSDADASSPEETVRQTRGSGSTGLPAQPPTGSTPGSGAALKQSKPPKSWAEVAEYVGAFGATITAAWSVYLEQAKALLFEGGEPILKEDKDRLWRVVGKAAQYLVEKHDPNQLPGPTRDDIEAVWQLSLREALGVDYELAGPEWKMDPSETDRPERESDDGS